MHGHHQTFFLSDREGAMAASLLKPHGPPAISHHEGFTWASLSDRPVPSPTGTPLPDAHCHLSRLPEYFRVQEMTSGHSIWKASSPS